MSTACSGSYPRPDFVRTPQTWTSLNGEWDFLFDDDDTGLVQHWYRGGFASKHTAAEQTSRGHRINVPFVFQTPESGINNKDAHEIIWYRRTFTDVRSAGEITAQHRCILRFGAVDYEAIVWVNKQKVGSHRGGHVPFELDITEAIDESLKDQIVTVRVRDSPYDLTQPRGKQYWKPQPESIFYTPSSGIWQTVWLESAPPTRIADNRHGTIFRSNDIESGILHAEVSILGRRAQDPLAVVASATFGHQTVSSIRVKIPKEIDHKAIDLPMWLTEDQTQRLPSTTPSISDDTAWRKQEGKYLALWSPERPLLYEVHIKLFRVKDDSEVDHVITAVGMRSIQWNNTDSTFRLNGKPYFQALVLDQGYWPQTNMTPPTPDALKHDIEISKAMGFNGCRKHQKVEDPVFLYWADRLGYLVWGEMANAYEFSTTYTDRFDTEWREAMSRDINHPSVVAWTPVNESWGYTDLTGDKRQRGHLRSLYHTTKTLDPTRPINDNCGWEHVCTDLTTFHEYADGPRLKKICSTMEGILSEKSGRPTFVPPTSDDPGATHSPTAPIICTEFGGVNVAPAEGNTAGERDWGYTTASDPEDLLKRIEALVMGVVEGGLCCGFVYTQLTDIEQEVNGLYTFDRTPKLDVAKVRRIMEKAKSTYYELLERKGRSV